MGREGGGGTAAGRGEQGDGVEDSAVVAEGTPSSRLCLGPGSFLPRLAGRLVGDTQAKASHRESQGQSQEVSARERLSASLLLPHPSLYFLKIMTVMVMMTTSITTMAIMMLSWKSL